MTVWLRPPMVDAMPAPRRFAQRAWWRTPVGPPPLPWEAAPSPVVRISWGASYVSGWILPLANNPVIASVPRTFVPPALPARSPSYPSAICQAMPTNCRRAPPRSTSLMPAMPPAIARGVCSRTARPRAYATLTATTRVLHSRTETGTS